MPVCVCIFKWYCELPDHSIIYVLWMCDWWSWLHARSFGGRWFLTELNFDDLIPVVCQHENFTYEPYCKFGDLSALVKHVWCHISMIMFIRPCNWSMWRTVQWVSNNNLRYPSIQSSIVCGCAIGLTDSTHDYLS